MRREDDRWLVTEVLIDSGDHVQLRVLDRDAGPPGLLDLLSRHAKQGDHVTLVHVGDTWTASTRFHRWPFDAALAVDLLEDRSPSVVGRADSRVLQMGAAGNVAMVTGAGGTDHRMPRWIFTASRRPASVVVGRITRSGALRMVAFSKSASFLRKVTDGTGSENGTGQPEQGRQAGYRRQSARSVVYRVGFSFPPVRRQVLSPSREGVRPPGLELPAGGGGS